MASAVYGGASHGHRLLARLAQPRRGLFRIPRRGPFAARLRPRRAREVAPAAALADGRGDRDHASPPRPLGRPRPVGLGRPLRSRRVAAEAEAVAAAGRKGAAPARPVGARQRGHVRPCLRGLRVRGSRAVHRRGRPRGHRGPGRPLRDPGLRLPRQGRPRPCLLRRQRAVGRARGDRARRRPAPLRGDARERRLRRARSRSPLARRRCRRQRPTRARSGSCSLTGRSSGRRRPASSSPTTGSSSSSRRVWRSRARRHSRYFAKLS